jgi:diadenosine tetraphosphate (Ap4A) HIT family hydrolase
LLIEDRSQTEYYKQIVHKMVGRVLTKNHNLTQREGDGYLFNDFAQLTKQEAEELVDICDAKVAEYLNRRQDPWSHRRKSLGDVPGTIKYEVLKRAHYRCELCGISAEYKALEADHILPRNHGGSDDLSNLQALCYSCNAMKRDRDDTSFRGMADTYRYRVADCPFCELPNSRVLFENELSVATRDSFPVTPLHTLIIPKRHSTDYFELVHPEKTSIAQMIDNVRTDVLSKDATVTGFNIGLNVGASAGQTVFHCHVHVIPRRDGDVKHPRGGVRGVIPERQAY